MSSNQRRVSRQTATRVIAAIFVAATAAITLTACGSSGDDSGNSASASTTASSSAAQAAAAKLVAGYTGKPTAFPVSEPLKAAPKPGLRFAYIDCGTTVCGLIRQIATPAVQAVGGKLIEIKTGTSASGVNAGFNSVLELKPDAIINGGVDPALWAGPLKEIKAAGIPIVSTGVAEDGRYGLSKYPNTNVYGANAGALLGKLEANYVYAIYGTKANALSTALTPIAATQVVSDSFTKELKRLCPSCSVRQLGFQPQELATTAPAKIVSDLQAHPGVNVVATGTDGLFQGLPAALRKASLEPALVGANANPATLQYVKQGQEEATIALDFPVMVWSMVDAALRAIQHQPVSALESQGVPTIQLLKKGDVTFDPSKGWIGYPDATQRFLKLWKPAQ
jgi:ribose transport system substrate-binding protein